MKNLIGKKIEFKVGNDNLVMTITGERVWEKDSYKRTYFDFTVVGPHKSSSTKGAGSLYRDELTGKFSWSYHILCNSHKKRYAVDNAIKELLTNN